MRDESVTWTSYLLSVDIGSNKRVLFFYKILTMQFQQYLCCAMLTTENEFAALLVLACVYVYMSMYVHTSE